MGGIAAAWAGARRHGRERGGADISRKNPDPGGHAPQKPAKCGAPAAKEKDGARSVLFLCVDDARQPLTWIANVLPRAPVGTCLPVVAMFSPKLSYAF